MKIKISGEQFSFDDKNVFDSLIVDLSGEFYLSSSEDKSKLDLGENDALLIESNEGHLFVKKETVKIEVVDKE